MSNHLLRAALLLAAFALLTPSAHAGFLGESFTTRMTPAGVSPGTAWFADPLLEAVADPDPTILNDPDNGVEIEMRLNGDRRFQVDISDSSFALRFVVDAVARYSAGEMLTISGLPLPQSIDQYTMTTVSPFPIRGAEIGDIKIAGDTLAWDLNEIDWYPGAELLLTVIPEPSSLGLLLLGLASGMPGRRRR